MDANAKSWIVRWGTMRTLGPAEALPGSPLERGDRLVVRTDRGTEVADVLCPASLETLGMLVEPQTATVLRIASPDDEQKYLRQVSQRGRMCDIATRLVGEYHLMMQIIDAENLLGNERLTFYFLAEKRIDFRELVRSMAREFQTRIELRQVGVRDEAKILADYGDCGKPVCCNTHMSAMPPVTMRMAKIQKSTLDPTRISGRCGRLKCCLRFENDVYEENLTQLPGVGAQVVTARGRARVIDLEILAKRLLVELEDGRRVVIRAEEVLTTLREGNPTTG